MRRISSVLCIPCYYGVPWDFHFLTPSPESIITPYLSSSSILLRPQIRQCNRLLPEFVKPLHLPPSQPMSLSKFYHLLPSEYWQPQLIKKILIQFLRFLPQSQVTWSQLNSRDFSIFLSLSCSSFSALQPLAPKGKNKTNHTYIPESQGLLL